MFQWNVFRVSALSMPRSILLKSDFWFRTPSQSILSLIFSDFGRLPLDFRHLPLNFPPKISKFAHFACQKFLNLCIYRCCVLCIMDFLEEFLDNFKGRLSQIKRVWKSEIWFQNQPRAYKFQKKCFQRPTGSRRWAYEIRGSFENVTLVSPCEKYIIHYMT